MKTLMRSLLLELLAGLLACVAPAAAAGARPIEPAAAPMPSAAEESYRYIAVIPGDCQRLVVADRERTGGCLDKLVNIDFGDGRVAFVFTSPAAAGGAVTTTFSGGRSEQGDRRSYRLHVDRITTTTSGGHGGGKPATVFDAVDGQCAMTGDPTHEHAVFACWAQNGAEWTAATFRSAGHPAVYAGSRAARDDDDTLTASAPPGPEAQGF